MSEASTTETPGLTSDTASLERPDELFSQSDIKEFDHEDVIAGKAIGKMLSLIFLYTLVAMSIASYWTWKTITGG